MKLAIFSTVLAVSMAATPASADVVSDWAELQSMAQDAESDPMAPYDPSKMAAYGRMTLAMFEAANAADPRYRSYLGLERAPAGTSVEVATATAAHAVLVELYPGQRKRLDEALTLALSEFGEGKAKTNAVTLGKKAARAAMERGGWTPRPSCRFTGRLVLQGAGRRAMSRFQPKCRPASPGF